MYIYNWYNYTNRIIPIPTWHILLLENITAGADINKCIKLIGNKTKCLLHCAHANADYEVLPRDLNKLNINVVWFIVTVENTNFNIYDRYL